MVSFFGLKFGDKKKKGGGGDKATFSADQENEPAQGWKKIDQNTLGEGQFFGQNVNPKGVTNGSIRSIPRSNTTQSRLSKSPYAHDTHNLAASSMFDLAHSRLERKGSYSSINVASLKHSASDAQIRGRFGAINGSSHSLAAPAAPGLGGGGGGGGGVKRPSTATGSAKPWVNPLDVHFMRATPTGPPTPSSPLARNFDLQPLPSPKSDAGSVFGEEADEMVDTIIASMKKKEEEEAEAKEKEKDLKIQQETARLEMERLQRQKSTESMILTAQSPTLPQSPTFGMGGGPGPVLRGNADQRPGSRGNGGGGQRGIGLGPGPGPLNGNSGAKRPGPGPPPPTSHHGPPRHGPPTGDLPTLPQKRPSGRGDPRPILQGHGMRPPPRPSPPPGLNIHNKPRITIPGALDTRPYSPSPLSPHVRGPIDGYFGQRAQSPAVSRPSIEQLRQGQGDRPPVVRAGSSDTLSSSGAPPPPPAAEPPKPLEKPKLLSDLMVFDEEEEDDGPIEQFARPIIQHVGARRDTLTLITPRRISLSMKIEELEKTLLDAQKSTQQRAGSGGGVRVDSDDDEKRRYSSSSSRYSTASDGDDDDDDEPIVSIAPAPLRTAASSTASSSRQSPAPQSPIVPQSPAVIEAPGGLPHPPVRGRPLLGRGNGTGPRRPALEEYGVFTGRMTPSNNTSQQPQGPPQSVAAPDSMRSDSRGPTPAADSRVVLPVDRSNVISPVDRSNVISPIDRSNLVSPFDRSHVISPVDRSNVISPISRSNTPQFRQPWIRDPPPLSPGGFLPRALTPRNGGGAQLAPIIPVVDPGFDFDFGPSVTPLTPDSAVSPLTAGGGRNLQSPVQGEQPPPATLNRPKIPPPLKFNFSKDAYSRQQAPWTPPLNPTGSDKQSAAGETQGASLMTPTLPTAGGGAGGGLAASPVLIPTPGESPGRRWLSLPHEDGAGGGSGIDDGLALGIGVARGLSIKEPRGRSPRPPPPPSPAAQHRMVDSFGTGFI